MQIPTIIRSDVDRFLEVFERIADALEGKLQHQEPETKVSYAKSESSLYSIAGTLDTIMVQITRIGDRFDDLVSQFTKEAGSQPEPDWANECKHIARRVTGVRLECVDCGTVIEDDGGSNSTREGVLRTQLERSELRCRDLEAALVKLNARVVQLESIAKGAPDDSSD
jgi:hypothetical protein